MQTDFTIEQLDTIHLSLITRERVIRESYIPNATSVERVSTLTAEADSLHKLSLQVCAVKLSKQMGFSVEPLPC